MSKNAFAIVHFGSNPVYLELELYFFKMLRKYTKHDILYLYSVNDTPPSFVDAVRPLVDEVIPYDDKGITYDVKFESGYASFNTLRTCNFIFAYTLDKYDKVCIIESDMVIMGNIDSVFKLESPAVLTYYLGPQRLTTNAKVENEPEDAIAKCNEMGRTNGGVMLIEPSVRMFETYVEKIPDVVKHTCKYPNETLFEYVNNSYFNMPIQYNLSHFLAKPHIIAKYGLTADEILVFHFNETKFKHIDIIKNPVDESGINWLENADPKYAIKRRAVLHYKDTVYDKHPEIGKTILNLSEKKVVVEEEGEEEKERKERKEIHEWSRKMDKKEREEKEREEKERKEIHEWSRKMDKKEREEKERERKEIREWNRKMDVKEKKEDKWTKRLDDLIGRIQELNTKKELVKFNEDYIEPIVKINESHPLDIHIQDKIKILTELYLKRIEKNEEILKWNREMDVKEQNQKYEYMASHLHIFAPLNGPKYDFSKLTKMTLRELKIIVKNNKDVKETYHDPFKIGKYFGLKGAIMMDPDEWEKMSRDTRNIGKKKDDPDFENSPKKKYWLGESSSYDFSPRSPDFPPPQPRVFSPKSPEFPPPQPRVFSPKSPEFHPPPKKVSLKKSSSPKKISSPKVSLKKVSSPKEKVLPKVSPPKKVKECKEDEEINEETGRCRKKCPIGTVRNEKGKCVANKTKKSKECKEGEEINKETGRCRKKCPVGTVRNEKGVCVKNKTQKVKECKEGEEINPATGRCRKVCPPGTVRNEKGVCTKPK